MRSKFFRKFFFTTAILIIISIALILSLVNYFINDYLIREKQKTLYDNCHAIAVISANNDDVENYDVVRDTMHALAESNDNVIFAVDENGKMLACGCDDWFVYERCPHSEGKVSSKITKVAMNEHYNGTGTFGGKFQEKHVISGIPLQNKLGVTVGSVYAASPVSSINTIFSDLATVFFWSSAIPIFILFIVEYIISYQFTKPLKLMAQAAKLMSEGDFSTKIPVRTKDEIGELSKSFNEMSEALALNENIRKDFVANVSHELRTPMTSIGGFIDGILDGTIPEKDTKKYLDIVSNEIKRLTRLVTSMFELSKLESGEKQLNLQEFNFTETLISILISKESDISNNKIQILGIEEAPPINITADKDLIHQVIYNLVDNAIKFNCKNGFIKFKLSSDDKNLSFKISNGGYIISKEDLPYVFDRFYKGDKARSIVKDSTGLGLHLVRTVLDIHGGSITVDSVRNEYTEFSVILPLK